MKRLIPAGGLRFYHWLQAASAATRAGFPARGMVVIGVTGTNGKTTTCHLIAEVLKAAGHKVAMLTTIDEEIVGKVVVNTSKMTTPTPRVLNDFLRRAREAGCSHVVLETSSHAIDQSRTFGINYQVAVLTNITRDHLDYHGTMEAYAATKMRLFADQRLELSVVNGDDSYWQRFLACPAEMKYVYGLKRPTELPKETRLALAEEIQFGAETTFLVGAMKIRLRLPGRFNVENALAAIAVGLGLGLTEPAIVRGIAAVSAVAGRMEQIDEGQAFRVIVDYAHTPDALEKLYTTLRETTKGRLIVVLGATGNRDKGKRPLLGKLAAEHGDVVILTNEDPYDEEPQTIIDEVAAGVSGKTLGHDYFQEIERRAAIEKAFGLARAGDTVVLSGKGAETVMMWRRGERRPWSDVRTARELLRKR